MTAERCPAVFRTDYGDRRCDLAAGHDGVHVRNDAADRPEYTWRGAALDLRGGRFRP